MTTTMKNEAEKIANRIKSNRFVAIRALLALYRYQTMEEKQASRTFARNGFGFSANDAKEMTRAAVAVMLRVKPGVTKPSRDDFGYMFNGQWRPVAPECVLDQGTMARISEKLTKYAVNSFGSLNARPIAVLD